MALRDHEKWWGSASDDFLRTERQLAHPVRTGIHDAAKNAGAQTVLECGCATAIDYPRYAESGIDYTGVDLTPNLIEKAKKHNPGIRIVEGSIIDLPFEDGSFDVVYCKDVLEHLAPEDYPTAIQQMWRVCKKGILIALFLKLAEETDVLMRKRGLLRKPAYYKNTYAREEFMKHLEALGGTIEEITENELFAVWKS